LISSGVGQPVEPAGRQARHGLVAQALRGQGGPGGSTIDPADLRWIWITHMDFDHIGNLAAVLELAPQARVVTNYLGMGKMGLIGLPQDRAWLLNPGQSLDVGDRRLHALRPAELGRAGDHRPV
jgi:glyoxylase-like metal-dependent hydrolase (beta-lactamase superfamily II)